MAQRGLPMTGEDGCPVNHSWAVAAGGVPVNAL